jgi:negative regulator of flagellin synthesis FlgM
MKISGKPPLFAPQAQKFFKEDSQAVPSSAPSGVRVENDTVDLSSNANEIREKVHTVNNLPDVREEKVAEMKRRIASGTYRIISEQVASHLIGETIENNDILSHIDSDRD